MIRLLGLACAAKQGEGPAARVHYVQGGRVRAGD